MESRTDSPFVSALIVVRNGEDMIGRCLDALTSQEYPKDRYEILVIDGMSDDNTVRIAKERGGGLPPVHIFENPKRLLASGWNIGVKRASAEYVVRLDAHAVPYPDFLRRNVETMLRTPDAACVGGSMETRSTTRLGEAISEVLSSPFGVGNSKFRTSRRAQYVDTVAYGLYRRELLLALGGFDEEMQRNQDLDMHARIRRAGWKFYLDPSIRTIYYARDSFKGFILQGWQNGWWNILTMLKDIRAVSIRHLVPLGFVLYLLITASGGFLWRPLWYALGAVLAAYLFLAIAMSIAGSRSVWSLLAKPALFFSLHGSYGAGSLACAFSQFVARVRRHWPRRPPSLPIGTC